MKQQNDISLQSDTVFLFFLLDAVCFSIFDLTLLLFEPTKFSTWGAIANHDTFDVVWNIFTNSHEAIIILIIPNF
jgi:hypothetical protein